MSFANISLHFSHSQNLSSAFIFSGIFIALLLHPQNGIPVFTFNKCSFGLCPSLYPKLEPHINRLPSNSVIEMRDAIIEQHARICSPAVRKQRIVQIHCLRYNHYHISPSPDKICSFLLIVIISSPCSPTSRRARGLFRLGTLQAAHRQALLLLCRSYFSLSQRVAPVSRVFDLCENYCGKWCSTFIHYPSSASALFYVVIPECRRVVCRFLWCHFHILQWTLSQRLLVMRSESTPW